jgi:hypothetical protein
MSLAVMFEPASRDTKHFHRRGIKEARPILLWKAASGSSATSPWR